MKDYYYKLGLERNASAAEIKTSYRKLSKALHPDKNNSENFYENILKEINEAYEILSNPVRKKNYDFKLNNQRNDLNIEKIINELNFIKKEKLDLINENRKLKKNNEELRNKQSYNNDSYHLKIQLEKFIREKNSLEKQVIELKNTNKPDRDGLYGAILIIFIALAYFYYKYSSESEIKQAKNLKKENKNLTIKIKDISSKKERFERENEYYVEKIKELRTKLKDRNNRYEPSYKNNNTYTSEKNSRITNNFIYKGEYLYKSKTYSFAPIFSDNNLKNRLYGVEDGDYIYIIKKEKKGVYKIWYLGSFGFISEGMLRN